MFKWYPDSIKPEPAVVTELNCLLMLAGLGRARLVIKRDGRQRWVRTHMLCPSVPGGIPGILQALESGDWAIAPSVRLTMVELAERDRHPGTPEECAMDLALLSLAGLGYARLTLHQNGDAVWVPDASLLLHFKTIASGEQSVDVSEADAGLKADCPTDAKRRTLVRMDECLRAFIQRSFGRAKAEESHNDFNKHLLQILITHELNGEAIAYKDFDGELAWKASDEFRQKFEGGQSLYSKSS